MKPEGTSGQDIKKPPSSRLGAISLQHLDGVHHPHDFMFRSPSHEEKGKASRVRWKNRCRFPEGLVYESKVKIVPAKSGGRMNRTRSMSRLRVECLRCIPLAASWVVMMSAPYRAFNCRTIPSSA